MKFIPDKPSKTVNWTKQKSYYSIPKIEEPQLQKCKYCRTEYSEETAKDLVRCTYCNAPMKKIE